MAFAFPERWPGDTRALYVRALEKQYEERRATRARILSETKRASDAKGKRLLQTTHVNRKYPEVQLGDRFGPWVVISILGHTRGSKVRVTIRCDCGRRKEAYDYNARLHTGRCAHEIPA